VHWLFSSPAVLRHCIDTDEFNGNNHVMCNSAEPEHPPALPRSTDEPPCVLGYMFLDAVCTFEKSCFCDRKTIGFSFETLISKYYFRDMPEKWFCGHC